MLHLQVQFYLEYFDGNVIANVVFWFKLIA